MNTYKALREQLFTNGEYLIVPIRMEDRFLIMNWRNEQIYHLRQNKPLTNDDQENYFNKVVAKLFEQEFPDQILFSYLENIKCIGYGGLVHINWIDRNAEISFVMDTSREATEFGKHWSNFLTMLEQVAFNELRLHKIYVYAFDLRPHLYSVLESCGFSCEATLKDHHFHSNKFVNVVFYSKFS